MRIGYSFWGFLYGGISDTPDGGRIHRLPLLKAMIHHGVEIICLQNNRDWLEAGDTSTTAGISFCSDGLPDLDAVIFEHRWAIPGRNTEADKDHPYFTPDLRRQDELMAHYVGRVPTLVWDKDMKLPQAHTSASVLAEAGLKPRPGRSRLLFSFDPELRQRTLASLAEYRAEQRPVDLIYIGNQYERDASFKKYFDDAGAYLGDRPRIFGNWTKYASIHAENKARFPNVCFNDRLHFKDVIAEYGKSLATVLIAPDRYYESGQITQRIIEALASHVIPLFPEEYRYVDDIVLCDLRVSSGRSVADKIKYLRSLDNQEIRSIILSQLKKMELYDSRLQAKAALKLVGLVGA